MPYPYPVSYLPLTLYGQDLRIAFMDVPPLGQPNGHTVLLFHGHNFVEAIRRAGNAVTEPGQAVTRTLSCRNSGARSAPLGQTSVWNSGSIVN